jgi:hypothetical protein
MKKYRLLTVLIMTLGVLLFNVHPALAALVPPSEFWGTVQVDGATITSGTIIGKIGTVQYGSAAIWDFETLGYWTYVLSIPPDDPTTTGVKEGGVDGDIVDIYVNGSKATQTGTWHSGPVRLDLTAFTTTVLVGDGTSPADKIVKGSDTNKAVSTFTLATNQSTDIVTALTVTGTNTGNVASSGVKLWRDSGSTANEWDSGDTQVGSAASFPGSTATFSSLNIAVTTTAVKYLITYNIAASPTNGQTMQAAVTGVTATNNVTNSDDNDATLTVDSVVPTVSFALQAASDSGSSNSDNITNAASPVIDATFSEAITGFASGDLSNAGTATGCSFAIGTGSGNKYPVTVSSCSAGTLIVRMASGGVSDTAGNPIAQTDSPTITLDRSVTVTFDLQTASDSGASTTDNITNVTSPVVDAIFGEAVTGFASGDLSNTGTATGCSFAVGTASGNTYPVTVSSCTAGTLIVRMTASGVTDVAGNAIAQTDSPSITIDRTVPTVTFDLQTASDTGTSSTDNLTNAASPVIDAIFSEAISGFAAGDLTNTGTATGCVFAIGTASGNTYPVTASSCTAGTLILRMATSGVTDTAGNNIAQTDGPIITIDRTAPTISIGAPSVTTTAAGPVSYTVTYADANFNTSTLAIGNITLNITGTANGTVAVTGTGLTRTVTISSISGNGSLGISIAAGTASDLAGNTALAAGPSTTFAVNNVVPTTTVGDGTSPADKLVKGSDANKAVSAFTLATSQGTDTVTALTVTGSGTGLTNVAASGLRLWQDNGTTANEWDAADTAVGSAGSFSGTTASFSGLSIPVATTATQYLITYTIIASPVNAQTMLGAVTSVTATNTVVNNDNTDATLTVDSVMPTVTFDLQTASDSGTSSTDNITNAATPVIDAIFSEAISGFAANDLSNTGTATGCVFAIGTASGNTYPVTVSSCSEGTLIVRMAAGGVTDTAGNNIAQTDGPAIKIDRTAPTISIGAPSATSTTHGPVTYTITYADTNFNSSSLAVGSITLNKTDTANGSVAVTGTGLTRTVTISNITGNGTLSISIAAGTASDLAGNLAPAAGPSTFFAVGNVTIYNIFLPVMFR